MSNRLNGKSALLFGASRGIGAAMARRFVDEGARIVVADTETDAGTALVGGLAGPDVARFVTADVSGSDDVQRAVDAALAGFGQLDIVVQNAGIYPLTLIENIEPAEWDRVLGVNLRGCYLAARAALAPMRARGYGRIIFTSSITGPRVTMPGHAHYSASKAGINGFIRAAALEFASDGITVNGIEPGNIATDALKLHRSADFIRSMQDMIPLGRLGTPLDVANAALFLASDEAAYITGTTILVDGGQTLPEGSDFRVSVP